MSDYQVVVLDIGKTNKKLFVYDSNLACLNPDEKGVVFDLASVDGLAVDDMPAIYKWMMDGLRAAAQRFGNIRAVSITTHGATVALLGKCRDRVFAGDGGLVFPIVSYTQDIAPEEEAAFYRDMGLTPEAMQAATGTARFGWLVNPAKQLHWLSRRFPARYAEVTDVLMFPQYLGYLLTGKKGVEPTYMGCHNYLLDIGGEKYSVVAERLGVADKLPALPMRRSWEALGTITPEIARATGLSPSTAVTMGAHDSNASLVPYFARRASNFVVQDSGTWMVTMSPSREAAFAGGELGSEVFFNRSVYGGPVKTAIYRGGAEFEFYRDKVLAGVPHPDGLDERTLFDVVSKAEAFSLPAIDRGTGIFPHSTARLVGVETIFRDAKTAWCVIDLGLAIQGCVAARMAGGPDVAEIFIHGNTGKSNAVYRAVVSTLFPTAKVYYASSGGAAYGSAILAAAAVEAKRPEELAERCRMDLSEIPKLTAGREHLAAYVEKFLSLVG